MANVNLIDSSNIKVTQSNNNISLDFGSETVVDSIRSKNLYNKDTTYVVGANNQNINNTILLKPNTDYYFKTGKSYTEIKLYDSSETQTRSLGGSDTTTEIGFTTQSNEVKAILIFYSGQSNVDISTFDFTGIQLETGTTATTYAPYQNLKFTGSYNDLTNKPIIYEAWSQSVSFELPTGRQALVLDGFYGLLLIWNPPDRVNSVVIYGDNIYNVSRASNNTTITISRDRNATWSVLILR